MIIIFIAFLLKKFMNPKLMFLKFNYLVYSKRFDLQGKAFYKYHITLLLTFMAHKQRRPVKNYYCTKKTPA